MFSTKISNNFLKQIIIIPFYTAGQLFRANEWGTGAKQELFRAGKRGIHARSRQIKAGPRESQMHALPSYQFNIFIASIQFCQSVSFYFFHIKMRKHDLCFLILFALSKFFAQSITSLKICPSSPK